MHKFRVRLYPSSHSYNLDTNLLTLLELHRNVEGVHDTSTPIKVQCRVYQELPVWCDSAPLSLVPPDTDTRSAVCQDKSQFISHGNALTETIFKQKSTGPEYHSPHPQAGDKDNSDVQEWQF